MALTPEEVVNQKFTITKFRDGYDLDQVDDFLDTIVEELREREAEKAELQAKIDELTEQLEAAQSESGAPAVHPSAETIVVDAPVPEPQAQPEEAAAPEEPAQRPDALKSSAMLQMALELHDKYVSEGETTRDKLIGEAEAKSTQMIEDAERTAHELVDEAQRRRTEDLKAHAEEMEGLQETVAELRGFENEYRSTLRSYIQSQLKDLDSSPEPLTRPDSLG
ncbi:DivIVA domain-containing protein [Leucobacter denitrificans]|uniref:Cell wall synthesis protein Wag31 n=1 Tax=Leucobacter denitrificans TaxID=683042 RepID=A0A7G9S640_9MICO|nr:DivIVA domain-containing protein [Leucobacter denitrificans]QNN63315.1 DivIVA domain-containing protein [Leucobacter denitrificans]